MPSISACADDNARRIGLQLPSLGEERGPVHFRHPEVGDDQIDGMFAQVLECLHGRREGDDIRGRNRGRCVMIEAHSAQSAQYIWFIIYDQ